MIKVSSKSEAWKVTKGYLGETTFDMEASERAGYKIYKNDKNEWVSDLGSRFEITTLTETVNVWFDDEPVEKEPETKPVTVYFKNESDCVRSFKYYNATHYTVETKDGQAFVVVWYGAEDRRASFPIDRLLSIQYDD